MSDWTESDLAAIKKAIASGVQSVKYADKTVTYHSMREMILARDTIAREVNQGSADDTTTTYAEFERD